MLHFKNVRSYFSIGQHLDLGMLYLDKTNCLFQSKGFFYEAGFLQICIIIHKKNPNQLICE